jgi:hypothetical protein
MRGDVGFAGQRVDPGRAWVNALQSKTMLLLAKAEWAGDLRNGRAFVKEGPR